MKLNDKVYDVMKWLVLIFIPAATTFYVVLDKAFGWGNAEVITTVSAAACTFLGAILGVSTAEYNKDVDTGK